MRLSVQIAALRTLAVPLQSRREVRNCSRRECEHTEENTKDSDKDAIALRDQISDKWTYIRSPIATNTSTTEAISSMNEPPMQIAKDATDLKTSETNDIERSASSGTERHGSTIILSAADDAGYHRSLTRRQIMMMTFGAGIGTGLWVGTGQALHYGKPVEPRYALQHANIDINSWSCRYSNHLYDHGVWLPRIPCFYTHVTNTVCEG
jgi:hypothetical protein